VSEALAKIPESQSPDEMISLPAVASYESPADREDLIKEAKENQPVFNCGITGLA
jgi:hypothetical protein